MYILKMWKWHFIFSWSVRILKTFAHEQWCLKHHVFLEYLEEQRCCNQMTMEVGNYLKPQLVKFYEGIKHVSAHKLVTNINTSCKKTILCIFQLNSEWDHWYLKERKYNLKDFFPVMIRLYWISNICNEKKYY